jgi:CDP-diacylglycerol--serine O-phosphatidyltransferase
LRSKSTFAKAILGALFVGSLLVLWDYILFYVLPAIFTLYLLYGFIRPRISRRMRREIEEEDEDDAEEAHEG